MFYRKISNNIKLSLTVPQYATRIFTLIDNNREWLSKWLYWPDSVNTSVDVENFIKAELIKFQQGTGVHTTIFYENNIVGVIGFNDIHNHIGRAGYWLSQTHSGKGIMTKCLNELIQLGFSYYPINEVQVHCSEHNIASCSIATSLGLTLTDKVNSAEYINGRWINHNIYSGGKETFLKKPTRQRAILT